MVYDANLGFSVECYYDPFACDACMIVVDMHVWYFDSGASKKITSYNYFFSFLETNLIGSVVIWTNH